MLCSIRRNNTEARILRPPYRYKSASVIASIRIAPTVSVRVVIRIVMMIIVWLAKAEAERSHLDSEPLLRPGRARRECESAERGRGDGKGGRAAEPQPSDLA